MIHREMGESEDAGDYFDEAIKVLEEIGEKRELSRTYYEYGLLLGDKELLDKAYELFEEMGLELWIEKTKDLV